MRKLRKLLRGILAMLVMLCVATQAAAHPLQPAFRPVGEEVGLEASLEAALQADEELAGRPFADEKPEGGTSADDLEGTSGGEAEPTGEPVTGEPVAPDGQAESPEAAGEPGGAAPEEDGEPAASEETGAAGENIAADPERTEFEQRRAAAAEAMAQAVAKMETTLTLECRSAILIEQTTGQVLYEMNADEVSPPASITKVMTLLLTMEAIEAGKFTLEDMVTASEHARSMGGSQIWLEPNEQMSVNDLLKAVAVASANDAAVALAELIAGSEEGFVELMNARAAELGMTNTVFKNASGLDEDGHVSTARDIAVMSRALLKYDLIKDYSTIWMDSLRGGATELVNTNRLVRFYEGATGLKTGTTDGAGSCLTASATRGEMSFVAVVLGSARSDDRFNAAKKLLDFGFANFKVARPTPIDAELLPIPVKGGVLPQVQLTYDKPDAIIVRAGEEELVEQKLSLASDVQAPVEEGQILGEVVVSLDGEELGRYNIKAAHAVERMTVGRAMERLFGSLVTLK